MRLTPALLLLLLPLLLPLPLAAQAASSGWLVIGVVGKWTISGPHLPANTSLTFGTRVTPDDTVTRDKNSDLTFGSFTLLVGDAHVTYACSDPSTLPDLNKEGCRNPISLETATARAQHSGDTLGGGLGARLLALLTTNPARYYSTVSRAAGTVADAVVGEKGNAPDLHPAFSALNKGSYQLTIQRLAPGQPPAPLTPAPVPLPWDPDGHTPSTLPPMPPGLYSLHVETTDGEVVGDAWVLVTPQADLATKSAAFADIIKTTGSWREDVPSSGVLAIQRAALDQLSR